MRLGWAGLTVLAGGCSPGALQAPATGPWELVLTLKDGFKVNPEAPSELELRTGAAVLKRWGPAELVSQRFGISGVSLPRVDSITLEGSIYVCQKQDAKVCIRERISKKVSLSAHAGPVVSIDLSH